MPKHDFVPRGRVGRQIKQKNQTGRAAPNLISSDKLGGAAAGQRQLLPPSHRNVQLNLNDFSAHYRLFPFLSSLVLPSAVLCKMAPGGRSGEFAVVDEAGHIAVPETIQHAARDHPIRALLSFCVA